MKKMLKLIPLTLLIFIMSPNLNYAQDTKFDLSRSIRFSGNTSTENITVKVKPDTEELHLSVKGRVRQGKLIIEIYDPNGVKQGYFAIESQVENAEGKTENVDGSIMKTIKLPVQGDWIVKIITKNAYGDVLMRTYHKSPDQ